MANIPQPKRQRDQEISLEQEQDPQDIIKRQKTYNQLISILEEDEEYPINDHLSEIFSTLQRELSSSSTEFPLNFDVSEENQDMNKTNNSGSLITKILKNEKEEDEKCNDVIKHLLQASDDELGLPGTGDSSTTYGGGGGGGGDKNIYMNDGLWEFEDENANYYAMLQSELFM